MTKSTMHLYTCDDCKRRQMLPAIAFNRRARPKCRDCGSTRLEPSQACADDIILSNTACKERRRTATSTA
jgi:DNA-directed RNA polymerase subunit RPC12/RpoP